MLARGRQVALAPVSDRESTSAIYLPSVNALALWWDIETPEGCDIGDTSFAGLLPLPAR